MTIGAHEALYKVMNARFSTATEKSLWGGRAQAVEIANAKLVRPYLLFFVASNMTPASNPHIHKAEIVLSVKGIAEDMATALAIQEAVTGLLKNSGTQDLTPRLPYNADWVITTVSEDRAIWLEELSAVGNMIYHAGHQYMFRMERR